MMLVTSLPGAVLQPAPNKLLPGGRKPAHLYEVSRVTEESKVFIDRLLAHGRVAGR